MNDDTTTRALAAIEAARRAADGACEGWRTGSAHPAPAMLRVLADAASALAKLFGALDATDPAWRDDTLIDHGDGRWDIVSDAWVNAAAKLAALSATVPGGAE